MTQPRSVLTWPSGPFNPISFFLASFPCDGGGGGGYPQQVPEAARPHAFVRQKRLGE